jgi:hypothetical protein
MVGEYENLLLVPLILWRPEPKCSLSNDHLSFWDDATSSEKVRIDQPSDDPHWDPAIMSLLQVDSTNDGLPSEIELSGDFRPRIRLSEICLNSGCPGDRWAHLDGVELGRLWRLRLRVVGVEKEEGIDKEIFGIEDSAISGDSVRFLAYW